MPPAPIACPCHQRAVGAPSIHLISDRPLTEQEWIEQRATIGAKDVTPALPDALGVADKSSNANYVSHLCSMISHPCETEKTGYGCCGWSAAPRRRWGPLGKVVDPGPGPAPARGVGPEARRRWPQLCGCRPDLSARQVAV